MALTRAEVQKVGLIARLKLEDDAIEGLQEELNNIVDFAEQMKELDLEGVEPTTHSTELTDSLRDDVPAAGLSRDALLMNAPQAKDGAFVVPRIKAPNMNASSEEGSA